MSEAYIGEIKILGFNFAPRSWAFCDGQLLAISQNTALFSLFGTIYGGDGRTTFGLPDLRGRMPIGEGAGPGLTRRSLGEKEGRESTTLTEMQLPTHNHAITLDSSSSNITLKAATNAGDIAEPVAESYLAKGNVTVGFDTSDAKNYSKNKPLSTVKLGGISASLNAKSADTGNGQPTLIMNPFLALNFSVALQGIYPSRN